MHERGYISPYEFVIKMLCRLFISLNHTGANHPGCSGSELFTSAIRVNLHVSNKSYAGIMHLMSIKAPAPRIDKNLFTGISRVFVFDVICLRMPFILREST